MIYVRFTAVGDKGVVIVPLVTVEKIHQIYSEDSGEYFTLVRFRDGGHQEANETPDEIWASRMSDEVEASEGDNPLTPQY